MSGGNLSPRQKMINVMYLVLIALLALNVSKEILKSFHMFEVSFNQSKDSLDEKIDAKIKGLEKMKNNDPSLVPFYERTLKAQSITDEFVTYIDGIINELAEMTEGRKEYEGEDPNPKPYMTELKGSDNIEKHANYFFVDNSEGAKDKGWRSAELENKINDTRTALLELVKNDKDSNGVKLAGDPYAELDASTMLRAELDASETKYKSWSKKYLEHTPLAGVATLLTKIQSDAKTLESQVVDKLSQGREQEIDIKELIPVVKTESNVVMIGQEFKAEIFLAARTSVDENTSFELSTGGSGPLTKENGVGIYSVKPSNQGVFPFSGIIKVKSKKGDKEYPFSSEYQAFQGQASISATKMNMLYIGVDNPISIAVPGVNPRDITASMSAGSLAKSGGNYVAKMRKPGNATISVSAKLSDGSSRNVGKMVYRVRKLPKPEARLGTYESGRVVPKPALQAVGALNVGMGPEFAFEGLKFRITGFQFIYVPRRGDAAAYSAKGPRLSGAMRGAIAKARKGDKIIIDRIRVTGPGGNRTLNPVIIDIR